MPCGRSILSRLRLPIPPYRPAAFIAAATASSKPNRSLQVVGFASLSLCGDRALPYVDRRGVEHGLDVRGVEFLDHLDAGAAVFRALVDVRTLHEPEADVGCAGGCRRRRAPRLSPRAAICAQRPASRRDPAATDRRIPDAPTPLRLDALAREPARRALCARRGVVRRELVLPGAAGRHARADGARPAGPGLVLRAHHAPSPRSSAGSSATPSGRCSTIRSGSGCSEFYGLTEGAEAFRVRLRQVRPLGHPPQGPDADPLQARHHHLGLCRLRPVLVRGAVDHHARGAVLRAGGAARALRRGDQGRDRHATSTR